MWKQGTIGIPDKNDAEHLIVCHYWVEIGWLDLEHRFCCGQR